MTGPTQHTKSGFGETTPLCVTDRYIFRSHFGKESSGLRSGNLMLARLKTLTGPYEVFKKEVKRTKTLTGLTKPTKME